MGRDVDSLYWLIQMFERVKVVMNCLKKENRQLLEQIKAMKECWFLFGMVQCNELK